ncbi:hypothetical protein HFN89_06805 [Rhizobium laguerreae]|nr:hypothetical protein [Rhizobium laguerreae]
MPNEKKPSTAAQRVNGSGGRTMPILEPSSTHSPAHSARQWERLNRLRARDRIIGHRQASILRRPVDERPVVQSVQSLKEGAGGVKSVACSTNFNLVVVEACGIRQVMERLDNSLIVKHIPVEICSLMFTGGRSSSASYALS